VIDDESVDGEDEPAWVKWASKTRFQSFWKKKLCVRWRRCDRYQMSAGSMLAALHATAVTAIAGRSSGGVQTASLQCFISISKFVDLYFFRSDYRKR